MQRARTLARGHGRNWHVGGHVGSLATAETVSPLGGLLCFDLYSAHRAITGVYRQILEPSV